MHPKPSATTPADFPDDTELGSVSGVISKGLARKIDGKFVAGMTIQERHLRYEACFDMLNQIVDYCHRKRAEQPELEATELFHKVCGILVGRQDWDFSPQEQLWMMTKLCDRMNWPVPT